MQPEFDPFGELSVWFIWSMLFATAFCVFILIWAFDPDRKEIEMEMGGPIASRIFAAIIFLIAGFIISTGVTSVFLARSYLGYRLDCWTNPPPVVSPTDPAWNFLDEDK